MAGEDFFRRFARDLRAARPTRSQHQATHYHNEGEREFAETLLNADFGDVPIPWYDPEIEVETIPQAMSTEGDGMFINDAIDRGYDISDRAPYLMMKQDMRQGETGFWRNEVGEHVPVENSFTREPTDGEIAFAAERYASEKLRGLENDPNYDAMFAEEAARGAERIRSTNTPLNPDFWKHRQWTTPRILKHAGFGAGVGSFGYGTSQAALSAARGGRAFEFDPNLVNSMAGFKTNALNALDKVNGGARSADAWRGELLAKGAKPRELSDIGFDDWASTAGSKITGDDLRRFLESTEPDIEVKILGGKQGTLSRVSRRQGIPNRVPGASQSGDVYKYGDGDGRYAILEATPDGRIEYGRVNSETGEFEYMGSASSYESAEHRLAAEVALEAGEEGTMFSQYSIPGGKPGTYREVLIRDKKLGRGELTADESRRMKELEREIDSRGAGTPSEVIREHQSLAQRQRPKYKSPHFKDQEIAHLRVDDREIEGFGRTLFVHEIQDDLGQNFGLISRLTGLSLDDMRKLGPNGIIERLRPLEERFSLPGGPELSREKYLQVGDAIRWVNNHGAPPVSALEGEQRHLLAVKQALLMAASEGYDSVAFARADQIAPQVGQKAEKLETLYGKTIPKFLKKFVRQNGGDVETGPIQTQIAPERWQDHFQTGQVAYAMGQRGLDIRDLTHDQIIDFLQTEYPERWSVVGDRITGWRDDPGNNFVRMTPELRGALTRGDLPLY